MVLTTSESVSEAPDRAELESVLQSPLFVRSPTLAHMLSYLCEKKFAGEGAGIKEYTIAVDVFRRPESFDQDVDSIVRVEANRLRKRLAEYYQTEGANHPVHISIPVGQYVPSFEEGHEGPAKVRAQGLPLPVRWRENKRAWLLAAFLGILVLLGAIVFVVRNRPQAHPAAISRSQPALLIGTPVGLPVGNEIRILAGTTRSYVDRSGKQWSPDAYYSGGIPVQSALHYIWRTQDPIIYRNSRQGDFSYDIPLAVGTFELHLHFAETFYGPEDVGGGGEGSRILQVTANGKVLLPELDVVADANGARTADVKVFTDIVAADDGRLHLHFSSVKGGRAMISAIEILPGTPGQIRPVRILARDVPYYSEDSRWWSSDLYFKGGQVGVTEDRAIGTDDPELYATERWGNFSYAVPVTPGKYTVTLYFIEHHFQSLNHGQAGGAGSRLFHVFCNGRAILHELNILEEAGENRPLVRKVTGLEPNAQGKLLLEFVPVHSYATVTAIEVLPQ